MPTPKRAALKRRPKARLYTTSELARSLAVPREHLLALCECGLIEARPIGRGDYIVGERERERVVREGLPELPADREVQADLIAGRRPTTNSASSVLAAKREEVQFLTFELQTEHAKRELAKYRQEGAEIERQRVEAQRAEAVARELALQQARAERKRDAERRERERREAEESQRKVAFEKRWIQWARDRLAVPAFAWLTFDQRSQVLGIVADTVATYEPAEEEIVRQVLSETIALVCAPWELARQAQAKREELLEESLRDLPWLVTTVQEKARAAAEARTALAQLPPNAADWEIRAALSVAIEPVRKSVEERYRRERRETIECLAKLVRK